MFYVRLKSQNVLLTPFISVCCCREYRCVSFVTLSSNLHTVFDLHKQTVFSKNPDTVLACTPNKWNHETLYKMTLEVHNAGLIARSYHIHCKLYIHIRHMCSNTITGQNTVCRLEDKVTNDTQRYSLQQHTEIKGVSNTFWLFNLT